MLYAIESWTQRAKIAVENQEPCGHLLRQLNAIIKDLNDLRKAKNPVDVPDDFIEMTYNFFHYAEESGLEVHETAQQLHFTSSKFASDGKPRPYHTDEAGRMFYSDTGKRIFTFDRESVLRMEEADKGPYISLEEVQRKSREKRGD